MHFTPPGSPTPRLPQVHSPVAKQRDRQSLGDWYTHPDAKESDSDGDASRETSDGENYDHESCTADAAPSRPALSSERRGLAVSYEQLTPVRRTKRRSLGRWWLDDGRCPSGWTPETQVVHLEDEDQQLEQSHQLDLVATPCGAHRGESSKLSPLPSAVTSPKRCASNVQQAATPDAAAGPIAGYRLPMGVLLEDASPKDAAPEEPRPALAEVPPGLLFEGAPPKDAAPDEPRPASAEVQAFASQLLLRFSAMAAEASSIFDDIDEENTTRPSIAENHRWKFGPSLTGTWQAVCELYEDARESVLEASQLVTRTRQRSDAQAETAAAESTASPASLSAGSSSSESFCGRYVVVHGTSKADLNGRTGFAASFDEVADRYLVHLNDGPSFKFRSSNLRVEVQSGS